MVVLVIQKYSVVYFIIYAEYLADMAQWQRVVIVVVIQQIMIYDTAI